MRHGKKVNHLGRTAPHRKALMANMASSLILHKRINTTLAKAKALRVYVEPLLTRAKNDTIHSRRTVFSYLKDKTAVAELFRDISNKIADRQGGYTRIIKLGNRIGDNAELAMIELVDYNEHLLKETKSDKGAQKKTRRRGAGKTTKAGAATAEPAAKAAEPVAAAPAVEEEVKAPEAAAEAAPEAEANETPAQEGEENKPE